MVVVVIDRCTQHAGIGTYVVFGSTVHELLLVGDEDQLCLTLITFRYVPIYYFIISHVCDVKFKIF